MKGAISAKAMFGKALLLFVAVLTVGGIFVAYSTSSNLLETEVRLAEDEYEILARNAALAGLNHAAQELAEDIEANSGTFTNNPSIAGALDGFDYAAQIQSVPVPASSSAWKRARITSTGTAVTAREKTLTFDVQAEYDINLNGGSGGSVPTAMQEAVNSHCKVELNGSVLISAASDGSNANIRTNDEIKCSGCGGSGDNKGVQGYGMVGDPNDYDFMDFFEPSIDLGGDHIQVSDPITEDEFNEVFDLMDEFRAKADIYVDPGLGLLDDDEGLGIDPSGIGTIVSSFDEIDFESTNPSENDPLIVWVADPGHDIHITGGTYPDYTIFIFDGDVEITGNASFGGDYTDENGYSTVAFYIAGDLKKASGNFDLYGQFFVGGEMKGTGDGDIYGSITTYCDGGGGKLELEGNFTVHYNQANPALTMPLEVSMERVTHSEW